MFSRVLNSDMKSLVCQGAVSVPFYINDCIKSYKSGIISDNNGECGCSKDLTFNHAVTIVGFGQDGSAKGCKKYWLVKNSWGTEWGEDGFMRVCRDDEKLAYGTCSIRYEAILPTKGHTIDTAII